MAINKIEYYKIIDKNSEEAIKSLTELTKRTKVATKELEMLNDKVYEEVIAQTNQPKARIYLRDMQENGISSVLLPNTIFLKEKTKKEEYLDLYLLSFINSKEDLKNEDRRSLTLIHEYGHNIFYNFHMQTIAQDSLEVKTIKELGAIDEAFATWFGEKESNLTSFTIEDLVSYKHRIQTEYFIKVYSYLKEQNPDTKELIKNFPKLIDEAINKEPNYEIYSITKAINQKK